MRRKILVLVALLLAYVGAAIIFLTHFNEYLNKPHGGNWDVAQAYLRNQAGYDGEPILFEPRWLKNYATDYSRFQGLDVNASRCGPVCWVFSMTDSRPGGYRVADRRVFGTLVLRKLVREDGGPPLLELRPVKASPLPPHGAAGLKAGKRRPPDR